MNPDARATVKRLAGFATLVTLGLLVVAIVLSAVHNNNSLDAFVGGHAAPSNPSTPFWILTALGAFLTVGLRIVAAEPKK